MRFHPILHINRMHNGADMRAGCGTPVVAVAAGRVTFAGWNGGYGRLVVIDHGTVLGFRVETKYAHLSVIGVRAGQQVTQAQGIALSGTTGLSTGCHLHFEVKQNGVYVNPAPWLAGKPSPRPAQQISNLNLSSPSTSPSPTVSPSPTRTSTRPSTTATASSTPTKTPSSSPSPSPTKSEATSASPTPTQSDSPSPTPTKSDSPSPSPTVETTTAEPQPTTAEPQPTTVEPQPTTAEPKPSTAEPKPTTAEPDPSASP